MHAVKLLQMGFFLDGVFLRSGQNYTITVAPMVVLNCWPQRHLLLRGDTYFRGVPTLELLFYIQHRLRLNPR